MYSVCHVMGARPNRCTDCHQTRSADTTHHQTRQRLHSAFGRCEAKIEVHICIQYLSLATSGKTRREKKSVEVDIEPGKPGKPSILKRPPDTALPLDIMPSVPRWWTCWLQGGLYCQLHQKPRNYDTSVQLSVHFVIFTGINFKNTWKIFHAKWLPEPSGVPTLDGRGLTTSELC